MKIPSIGVALLGTYGASKFAQRALTQVAACEWAQHGIRVNGYAPGPTDTPMRKLASLELLISKFQ